MTRSFSVKDRKKQLSELRESLYVFLSYLKDHPEIEGPIQKYEACLHEVDRLSLSVPTQDQLSELSRSVPHMFWLHKEWNPMMEMNSNGNYQVPSWFNEADKLHERLINVANVLRTVGSY